MVMILAAAIVLQAVAIAGLCVLIAKDRQAHRAQLAHERAEAGRIQADLLDRLMSRNFLDYTSGKKVTEGAPRRRSMTDEFMADLEAKRLEAQEAALRA